MKNYFFSILSMLLLSTQIFAQKTLSPGVRPFAENWTYTLVHAMHRAGFDMPTKASASGAKRAASRSALQLDSTKTYYGYNLNAPGDSTPLFRSTYQYPQADTKIEYNYQWENNAWLTLNRTTFISDGQQRIVEAFAEAYDPATQSFIPDSRLEVFPHGNSQELVDSFFTYLWDSTILDWRLILAAHNSFDDQDRLLESISTVAYFGDPLIFKDVYSYDANGDNYLIEEFAILGSDVFPGSRTDLVYVDHRPIEVTVSVSDGVNFLPQSRTNYAYTLFGAVRKTMSFEWSGAGEIWVLTQVIDYGFDNEQRVASKETTFTNQDGSEERDLVTYAYIEDENLSLEMAFIWDEDLFDWVLDSKTHYYYDGVSSVDPGPGTAHQLRISPNPTTGLAQLAFDTEADVRVFDTAGQMVQSSWMMPGQLFDISGLPAGIYAVTARTATDFYSGKIVKQ